jgi:multiple sugar transport system substrate-binding protein
MTTADPRRHRVVKVPRRQALRLMGGVGAAALLAACGTAAATPAPPTSAPGGGAAPATTGAPRTAVGAPRAASAAVGTPAASPAAAAGAIRLPNTGARLPTQNVTFRWTDSGDSKAVFFKAYFAEYQRAHPNITMQYDGLPWTEIAKVVPIGVQNGNAPDVFQVPQNVPPAQAVREGWVAPLDDAVPDFARWKAAFPPNSFFEGVNVFGGKTYTFPRSTSKRSGNLIFYNLDYMQQAGYDPAAKPLTWDEFRAAAKKITEGGKGQYFGFITGGNQAGRWASTVSGLAQVAGASSSNEIDLRTGEYVFTSDQYLAAIDLLLALKADGSVFPGALSINEAEARARMPQGAAGMIFAGEFASPLWIRDSPGFRFGVASTPVPNTGTPLPLTYSIGANHQWLYAKSPNREVAGDILYYLGTEEGQTTFVTMTDGSDPAAFPGANRQARIDERTRRCYTLYDQLLRLGPMPVVRNPDVAQVLLEQKPVQPDFGQVIQGIYTGQIGNPRAAMKDLQDRTEKEQERAIKAAQAKGAQVSRDDWRFANWDPTRDYTQEDYDALGR